MAVVVAAIAGAIAGIGAVVLVRWVRSHRAGVAGQPRVTVTTRATPADAVLDLLPTGAVLLDEADEIVLANKAARRLGVVRNGRLTVPDLRELVRRVRRIGATREAEVSLESTDFPRRMVAFRGVAHAVGRGHVALVVDDVSEARRVEAVRRDFVANVGHEIKTPVGAIALLIEAAQEAGDDASTVRQFLSRMQREVQRLARLVQELLDLSRLQGAEPLPEPLPVPLKAVVDEAVDRSRLAADAKRIELVQGGALEARAAGSEQQLVTAVANLLDNAVAYSPEGTRVAIGVREDGDWVEVSVTDQGIGIDEADRERIFERFYRVDPARSRATGGTGLGLAIVKHIVTNHGGEVRVWSQPGDGSTFTLRLPRAQEGQQA